jgi:hypothetical protein
MPLAIPKMQTAATTTGPEVVAARTASPTAWSRKTAGAS